MLPTTARKLIWQERLWIAASVCGNFVLCFLGAKVVLWWQVSSQLRSGNSFLGRPCLQTNLRCNSCLPHGLEEETVWVKRQFGQQWVHLKSESLSTRYLLGGGGGGAQVGAFLRLPLSGARESGGGAHAQSRWGGTAGARTAVKRRPGVPWRGVLSAPPVSGCHGLCLWRSEPVRVRGAPGAGWGGGGGSSGWVPSTQSRVGFRAHLK